MTREEKKTLYGPDGRPISPKPEEGRKRHESAAVGSAESQEDEKTRLEVLALKRSLRPWYKKSSALVAALGALSVIVPLALEIRSKEADLRVATQQLAEAREARSRARAESDSLGMKVALQTADFDSLTVRMETVRSQLDGLGTNVESIQYAVAELPDSPSKLALIRALEAAGLEISAIQAYLPSVSVSFFLQLLTTSPPNGASVLAPSTEIRFLFSEALDPASVDQEQVQIVATGGPVSFRTSLALDGRLLLVKPNEPLPEGKVTIRLGPHIRGISGASLWSDSHGAPADQPLVLSFDVKGS